MIGDNIGLIEMGVTLGLAVVVIAYQYWATSRSLTRDKKARETAEPGNDATPE